MRKCFQESKWSKANWIGHILSRKCLIKQVIERKIEGMIQVAGWRGRRHKQLLDDLKEKTGYCKLTEEPLDRTLWRTRFGRSYGPVVRQTLEWMYVHTHTHTHTHTYIYVYIYIYIVSKCDCRPRNKIPNAAGFTPRV